MNTPQEPVSGRTCPLDYRYKPADFLAPVTMHATTAYIVGGLYGNSEALRTILAMKEAEERHSPPVSLIFNGDFNWFDIDAEAFRSLNTIVLRHAAIKGNVEFELAQPTAGIGCGCAYPSYVDQNTVDRSNAIMARLQETAANFPDVRQYLARLPLHLTLEVAGQRIGVVHGDPESLAGWSFAVESMPPIGSPGATPSPARTRIEAYFRAANVSAFACSHTCLPFLQDFIVDDTPRAVINNGAAGMPNFHDSTYGVLTRISAHPRVPRDSLYGCMLNGVRIDALPIAYDHNAWITHFLASWPENSPAHASYFDRILHGPSFRLDQAMRLA